MKKKLFALLLTVLMIFAFTTMCFAASSPEATVRPTDSHETTGSGSGDNNGKKNTSDVSPKTGYELGGSFVVMITALGVAIVSMKKYSEC